jgi:hypothetical protein
MEISYYPFIPRSGTNFTIEYLYRVLKFGSPLTVKIVVNARVEAGRISEKITRGKKHTLEDRVTSCIVRDEMGVWGRFFTIDIGNYNSNGNLQFIFQITCAHL